MAEARQFDEFEEARKRLRSQASRETSRRQEALKRQFARLGGLGSGQFVKLQQQAQAEIGEKEREALTGIEAAQRAEQRRLREIEEQRKFASTEAQKQRQFVRGEREAGQRFGAEQAGIQRGFAGRQASEQRSFAAEQARLSRLQQESQFVRGLASSEEQNRLNRALQNSLAWDKLQFAKERFEEEKRVNEFNKMIAQSELAKPTDLLGSLLGPTFSTTQGPIGQVIGGVGNVVESVVGGFF